MLWSGIMGSRLVCPVMVPEFFKVMPAALRKFLKDVYDPWLDFIHPSLLTTLIAMHNNALSHSSMVSQAFLGS